MNDQELTSKQIFSAMAHACNARDKQRIKELRKEISRRMTERGCFYDENFGWIRHDRVQESINNGWLTYDDKTETYLTTGHMGEFNPHCLQSYLQGGVLVRL